MTNAEQLRAQAHRLLALAMKASERGDSEAEQLTERALYLLDRASAAENIAPLPPESTQRPAVAQQQQQQIQAQDKDDKK